MATCMHWPPASGSALYAGGYFAAIPGVAGKCRIEQWNGSSWSLLGSGLTGNPPIVDALL